MRLIFRKYTNREKFFEDWPTIAEFGDARVVMNKWPIVYGPTMYFLEEITLCPSIVRRLNGLNIVTLW
jgi:hypothetical protein